MTQEHTAKFGLGQIVRHREQAFRGLVVDVDAVYAGPIDQPGPEHRDQPFYRVLAMGEGLAGEESSFLVYAAEGVLEIDTDVEPLSEDDQAHWFTIDAAGHHAPAKQPIH